MEDRQAKDFVPEFADACAYTDCKNTGQQPSTDGGLSVAFLFAKDSVTMNPIVASGVVPGSQKQG